MPTNGNTVALGIEPNVGRTVEYGGDLDFQRNDQSSLVLCSVESKDSECRAGLPPPYVPLLEIFIGLYRVSASNRFSECGGKIALT